MAVIRNLCLALVSILVFWFSGSTPTSAQTDIQYLETKVVEITNLRRWEWEGVPQVEQTLKLEITSGNDPGTTIEVVSGSVAEGKGQEYQVGDKLVVQKGQDINGNPSYNISDFVRRDALVVLFGIFALLAIAIAGRWGVTSLIGMVYSFSIIFGLTLPWITNGLSPTLAAIGTVTLIVPVTFYLSHGFNAKTHLAIVGTIVTLAGATILATFFMDQAHLSGFGNEEVLFLQIQNREIDVRGLLLAGIIIGLMGILDDITTSQASVVKELKEANSKLTPPQLFQRAMAVGRDHISSLVNTLVLVYAGSSLPLLLLFTTSNQAYSQVVNFEPIAEEIVRTLVGSIGLIAAVPVVTILAAMWFGGKHLRS